MINWIKQSWRELTTEVFLKSTAREGIVDTFLRWVGAVLFLGTFFFLIYHFDEYAVRFDQWGHQKFGWKLSDVPSSGKVAWHRLTAGVLAGVGVIFVTLGYCISLYRRIKARIAVSKAKAEQLGSDYAPGDSKP